MKSRAAVLHAQPGKWEVGPHPPLNQAAPTLRGE
ncbi:MAG: hypothetical protein JWN96_2874 [Mycobacterium sp.]|nr:hypothetical protein [Mycobacterium sp.]